MFCQTYLQKQQHCFPLLGPPAGQHGRLYGQPGTGSKPQRHHGVTEQQQGHGLTEPPPHHGVIGQAGHQPGDQEERE